jgi:hypothetical protein
VNGSNDAGIVIQRTSVACRRETCGQAPWVTVALPSLIDGEVNIDEAWQCVPSR